jgi:zeta-carotene desaturase
VGGGYAGIAAAFALADSGLHVTLLEARRAWGGRATSWPDPKVGDPIDSGQHVWLGCYARTMALLARLGTAERVRFPDALVLVQREPGGRETRLDAGALPGRLGLAWGLARWGALSFGERMTLARTLVRAEPPHPEFTVADWLGQLREGEAARRAFWRPLVEAAINEPVERAPATLLHAVIVRAFRGTARDAAVGVPTAGLADLLADVERVLAERGGEARRGAPVRSIAPRAGGTWSVELDDGASMTADAVVCATPADEARALLAAGCPDVAESVDAAAELAPSPIVTATLWFDAPVLPSPMIGFVAPPAGAGPGFHWAFDRDQALGVASAHGHAVTLVASAARELAPRPTGEILERAHASLELYGLTRRRATFGRVVKEPRATPSFTPATLAARPPAATARRGLALAGDWTATGLPATIEGAVVSGESAAAAIVRTLSASGGPEGPRGVGGRTCGS